MPSPFDRAISRLQAAQLRTFGRSVSWTSNPPLGDPVAVTLIPGSPNSLEDYAYAIYEGLKSAFDPEISKGDQIEDDGVTCTVYDFYETQPNSGWLRIRCHK